MYWNSTDVRLNYEPVHSLKGLVDEFNRVTNDPSVDSVEGILFSLNQGVIMNGTFVDKCEVPEKLNSIGLWFKPWFYTHIEKILAQAYE